MFRKFRIFWDLMVPHQILQLKQHKCSNQPLLRTMSSASSVVWLLRPPVPRHRRLNNNHPLLSNSMGHKGNNALILRFQLLKARTSHTDLDYYSLRDIPLSHFLISNKGYRRNRRGRHQRQCT
jgi:hypothetical protein